MKLMYQYSIELFNAIQASRAILQHKKLENAKEEIDAMDSLRAVTSSTGFARTQCFPYGYFYLQWEGNRVHICKSCTGHSYLKVTQLLL